MGYDICEIDAEGGKPTIRVDIWDATGRHWLYYFREEDDELVLFATTEVPYKGDRIETEFGIRSAEEKLEDEGYSVRPYDE